MLLQCYHPAQLNLIHRLGAVKEGCVIVLVGDYHFSDIKVVEPGSENLYSEWYRTDQLRKPIYQVGLQSWQILSTSVELVESGY